MAIRLATATRDAMADALAALANGGSIEVRSGTQPASANTAASGTLLATLTLPNPAYTTSDGGVITIDADPDIETTGAAAGAAGWARVLNSTGGTVLDGSVATSGGDFTINSTSITVGGVVKLTAGTLTMPSGE